MGCKLNSIESSRCVPHERLLAELRDAGEDFIRIAYPLEWHRVFVVSLQELVDGRFDGTNASMDPSLQLLLGESREEALVLVEPGRVSRSEVQAEARVLCEPACDLLGFVGREVVQDNVDVQIGGDGFIDEPQECDELYGSMAPKALSDDTACRDV